MTCKCGGKIIQQKNTRVIAPNEYELTDALICKVCKLVTRKTLAIIDKNTNETRKILLKERMEKLKVAPKDFSESSREDINVETLFD